MTAKYDCYLAMFKYASDWVDGWGKCDTIDCRHNLNGFCIEVRPFYDCFSQYMNPPEGDS